MVTKYDNYMKKELPYRMALEELFDKSNQGEWYREEDVLAYIRERGVNFTCLCPASTPDNMHGISPLGMMVSGRSNFVPCKIYTKGYWNALDEKQNPIWPDHFSYLHKIQVTPIEFEGCVETFYFSDFVHMIQEGRVILQEINF